MFHGSGDIITAINGQPIKHFEDLGSYLLLNTKPGETITLTILRNGKKQTVKVTLGNTPPTLKLSNWLWQIQYNVIINLRVCFLGTSQIIFNASCTCKNMPEAPASNKMMPNMDAMKLVDERVEFSNNDLIKSAVCGPMNSPG